MNFNRKTIVVAVADTHCGSQYGLMLPKPWQLDDGGFYTPSEPQEFLYDVWVKNWTSIAKLRKRARLIIVFVGDAVQGTDKKFMSLVSKRAEEHEEIHVECMKEAFKIVGFDQSKNDELYYIRGTPRHSELGSVAEERIAKTLGANRLNGKASNMQLQLTVNGTIFDFIHKRVKKGTRWWTQDNALFTMAKDVYARVIDHKWFKSPFELVYVSAHFHQWLPHQTCRGPQGNVTIAVCPAFQLMSGYAIEVTKGLERASIGMLAYEVQRSGSWRVHEYVYEPNHLPIPSP